MDLLTWTFTIIGIGVSFIPLLFGLFQYFNKKGNPKSRVVKKSFVWGTIPLVTVYVLGLLLWVNAESDFDREILINTEIVLDCSTAMGEPFDVGTKLDIAKGVIQKILSREVAENDNLAFRQFGGPCEGKNNWLRVKFSTNNEQKILKALQGLETAGRATLVDAIVEATGDFNDVRRFRDVNKKIIVITGSNDSCVPSADKEIQQRLEYRNSKDDKIELSFRFIGMGIPFIQKEKLIEISKATGSNSQTLFVDTEDELESALRKVLVLEPDLVNADAVLNNINVASSNLDEFINDLDEKNYSLAENRLKLAHEGLQHTNRLLEEIEKKPPKEQIQKLFELLKKNRDEQARLIELSEIMITQMKAGNSSGYNETATEWNVRREIFNNQIVELNELLNQFEFH